jgi:hypothetical protein
MRALTFTSLSGPESEPPYPMSDAEEMLWEMEQERKAEEADKGPNLATQISQEITQFVTQTGKPLIDQAFRYDQAMHEREMAERSAARRQGLAAAQRDQALLDQHAAEQRLRQAQALQSGGMGKYLPYLLLGGGALVLLLTMK